MPAIAGSVLMVPAFVGDHICVFWPLHRAEKCPIPLQSWHFLPIAGQFPLRVAVSTLVTT